MSCFIIVLCEHGFFFAAAVATADVGALLSCMLYMFCSIIAIKGIEQHT
jgi:hypothetical protein